MPNFLDPFSANYQVNNNPLNTLAVDPGKFIGDIPTEVELMAEALVQAPLNLLDGLIGAINYTLGIQLPNATNGLAQLRHFLTPFHLDFCHPVTFHSPAEAIPTSDAPSATAATVAGVQPPPQDASAPQPAAAVDYSVPSTNFLTTMGNPDFTDPAYDPTAQIPAQHVAGPYSDLHTDVGGIINGLSSNQALAISATTVQAQQATAKPGYLAVDASADAVFPIANIQGSTPTYVSVTASASAIGFIPTPDNGRKLAVIWLGQNTSSLTGFFINVYKLNTTTGVLTLIEESPNILSLVSNTLAWNYYDVLSSITSSVGDVYGAEVVVTGSGTYSIAGLPNHWLPANTQVIPQQMGATRAPLAVTYDATGAGYSASPGATSMSGSWTHTATFNATVVVSVAVQQNTGTSTITASYDGIPMTSLGSKVQGAITLQLFGIQAVAGGSKTVAITASGGSNTIYNIAAQSDSYLDCSGFQTAVTNGGSGTALSSGSVPSALQNMVVSAFAAGAASSFTMSSYSGTQRYSGTPNSGGNYLAAEFGDTPGLASSTTVTATDSSAVSWAGVAVDLLPGLEPTPTTPAFTYSGNVPWFGLGGFAVSTATVTHYTTPGTYTYSIPNWMKWGDKLDVVGFPGGGAGGSSAAFVTGYGGLAGTPLTQTLVYGVDFPLTTTALSVVVPAGGASGSSAGGPGGNLVISGSGLTTLTAVGGIGGRAGGGGGSGSTAGAGGTGPGTKVFNGVPYVGGTNAAFGSAGNAPGGGAGGGASYNPGNPGAPGAVWITAYQAGTNP